MKKYTFDQISKLFREYNSKNDYIKNPLCAVAVFKQELFKGKQTLEGRSYVFDSCNKMFESGMIGYSCFAGCLADKNKPPMEQDSMRIEHMGEGVEYCYLTDKSGKPI